MPLPNTCKARVVGDQYICSKCGYTWDRKDTDPPKCKESTEKPRS